MYEHRMHPLLSRADFKKRIARHVMLALSFLAFALGIGVVGYHYLTPDVNSGHETFFHAAACLA